MSTLPPSLAVLADDAYSQTRDYSSHAAELYKSLDQFMNLVALNHMAAWHLTEGSLLLVGAGFAIAAVVLSPLALAGATGMAAVGVALSILGAGMAAGTGVAELITGGAEWAHGQALMDRRTSDLAFGVSASWKNEVAVVVGALMAPQLGVSAAQGADIGLFVAKTVDAGTHITTFWKALDHVDTFNLFLRGDEITEEIARLTTLGMPPWAEPSDEVVISEFGKFSSRQGFSGQHIESAKANNLSTKALCAPRSLNLRSAVEISIFGGLDDDVVGSAASQSWEPSNVPANAISVILSPVIAADTSIDKGVDGTGKPTEQSPPIQTSKTPTNPAPPPTTKSDTQTPIQAVLPPPPDIAADLLKSFEQSEASDHSGTENMKLDPSPDTVSTESQPNQLNGSPAAHPQCTINPFDLLLPVALGGGSNEPDPTDSPTNADQSSDDSEQTIHLY